MQEYSSKRLIFRSTFVAVWVLLWLSILSPFNNSSNPQHTQTSTKTHLSASKPQNPITFSYTSCDPANNSRPVFNINFSEFKTEMGSFGFFKTGMYNIAKLKNLSLTFYDYPQTSRANTDESNTADSQTAPPQTHSFANHPAVMFENLALTIQDNLKTLNNNLLDNDLALKSIAEVSALNFKYRFVQNNKSACLVTSKRFIASYKDSDITLRGHVTITNEAGKKLQCNHAKWDMQNQLFNIEGFYIIEDNGQTYTGSNSSFDFNLMTASNTNNNLQENIRCFAKSH